MFDPAQGPVLTGAELPPPNFYRSTLFGGGLLLRQCVASCLDRHRRGIAHIAAQGLAHELRARAMLSLADALKFGGHP
jgi:hypothetical protein